MGASAHRQQRHVHGAAFTVERHSLVRLPLETEDEAIDVNDLGPVRQWLLVYDGA
jgi:hypothetical protein